jgi:uncharacterized small protein (DUF1192 family)
MLFDDDTTPQKQSRKPRVLDNMSVEELRAYINDLKAEIVRAEEDIRKKEAHKEAASSIFRK